MTSAMGLGLLTIFLVDLADIFFLSLLNDPEITAAMGFVGPVLFFSLSICIGSSIAMSALVSRQIGAGDEAEAKVYATNIFLYGMLVTGLLSLVIWFAVPEFLKMLGATGRTHAQAVIYLRITLPSMPILSIAMAAGSVLRAVGDPKRSALAMLSGSLMNAALDPLFIFVLDMGIAGAAVASVIARITIVIFGLYWIAVKHRLLTRFSRAAFTRQLNPYISIAFPVILTNIATPVGHAVIIAQLAQYGDDIMSGSAIVWRVVPVAFFGLFALSGALGPIFGQNFGAHCIDRVRSTFSDALRFVTVYMFVVTIVLFMLKGLIIDAFQITGDGAMIAAFYLTWIAVFFLFDGAQFAANSAFNNLGHPGLSATFNWGKATLGTIPFVILGSMWWGASGVFIGVAVGSVLFGTLAVFTCFRLIRRLELAEEGPLE
ncbi:MAG: MATE family efflux transporter [bacterium]|nr:MATE family efflux transporter [bacterium]